MSLEQITNLIDKKIEKEESKVVVSFYELKIKENLSDEELERAIKLISTRLTNMKYAVYQTGEKYIYEGKEKIVERNELIVAIKDIKKEE